MATRIGVSVRLGGVPAIGLGGVLAAGLGGVPIGGYYFADPKVGVISS